MSMTTNTASSADNTELEEQNLPERQLGDGAVIQGDAEAGSSAALGEQKPKPTMLDAVKDAVERPGAASPAAKKEGADGIVKKDGEAVVKKDGQQPNQPVAVPDEQLPFH